jgi:cbb3-type cytochrome oxidase cytochrome c subunit
VAFPLLALIVIAAIGVSGCSDDSKEAPGPKLSPDVERGREVFVAAGCLNCHVYDGEGAQSLGAPELTREGERNRGIAWQIRHLRKPADVVPGSPMPSFAGLGQPNLRALAAFLEASRGQIELAKLPSDVTTVSTSSARHSSWPGGTAE